MKRRGEAPAAPRGYADAWARLFARSPAELEAEKQARHPAPLPPGSRKGPISASQSTQTTGALPMPHLPEKEAQNA